MNVNYAASAFNAATGGSLDLTSSVDATWANASSGAVSIAGSVNVAADSPDDAGQRYQGGGQWVYRFTAEGDGTLSLDYLLSTSVGAFPESVWFFTWIRNGTVLDNIEFFDPAGPVYNGNFTRPVTTGSNYELALVGAWMADANPDGLIGNYTRYASLVANWSIAEGPPPPPKTLTNAKEPDIKNHAYAATILRWPDTPEWPTGCCRNDRPDTSECAKKVP